MKTKLVLWGTDAKDEKVLIGMELLATKNKVNVYSFPGDKVTEEFNQKLMQEWRDGGAIEFPEGFEVVERELTITESLLPENIKVERGDLVQRAQTEWHFIVLSSKLNDTYKSELAQIRDKVDQLEKFDSKVWETLKSFWSKVQGQVKERNLFKEHADTLRDMTNELFAQLKNLRTKLDEEFKLISQKHQEEFMAKLEEINQKLTNGLHLQSIFEELKALQRKFRDTKFTREHRSKVWQKLDGSFKTLKEKRFGSSGDGGDNRSPMDRLVRRYEGLLSAIEKMERSIKRDQNDLKFEDKRIANTDGQLEAQIRQAKVLMIEERIRSKEEKLKEMHKTKAELEKRMENQKVKDAKRAEREKLEAAKKAAEAKIASEIKEASKAREEDENKLKKAAEAIASQKTPNTTDQDTEPQDTGEQSETKEVPVQSAETTSEAPKEAPIVVAEEEVVASHDDTTTTVAVVEPETTDSNPVSESEPASTDESAEEESSNAAESEKTPTVEASSTEEEAPKPDAAAAVQEEVLVGEASIDETTKEEN